MEFKVIVNQDIRQDQIDLLPLLEICLGLVQIVLCLRLIGLASLGQVGFHLFNLRRQRNLFSLQAGFGSLLDAVSSGSGGDNLNRRPLAHVCLNALSVIVMEMRNHKVLYGFIA